ncbi:MAG: transporter substrate-binding domain-containing protein [Coriobacteriia bacterium]|nr:transporter substrate-binding domain-containing protein [Coriobacteriia bacterium]
MKSWRRVVCGVLMGALLISSLGMSGCMLLPGKEGSLKLKQATISSPSIGKNGVLRVGVDSSRAPYAGLVDGEIVGIDVDISAAIAEEMGLKLEIVDIKNQDAVVLLKDGTIDVVMGIQSDFDTTFTEVMVGPYLIDGPAIFTVGFSNEPSQFDPDRLIGTQMAAQEGSKSAWQAGKDYGEENVTTFETLTKAFDQLEMGAYSYVAADAIVGSFMAIKRNNIYCMGILGDTQGIYMGVASEKSELATELTKALRALRDNGILQIIVAKWLGPLSAKVVASDSAITSLSGSDPAGSTGASGTQGEEGADGEDPDDDEDDDEEG